MSTYTDKRITTGRKEPTRPLREPLRTPTSERHHRTSRTERTNRQRAVTPNPRSQISAGVRAGVRARVEVEGRTKMRSEATARWNREAVGLLAIAGFLSTIGLVFVLSASSVYSLGTNSSVWDIFLRQLGWEAVGIVAFVLCLWVGLRALRNLWSVLWLVTIAMLLAVKFTPLGVSRNGSTRWIGPRSFEIQPSELAKLAIVASFAHLLSLKRDYSDWRFTAKVFGGAGLPLIGLVALQPDLGTTIVIVSAGFSVLWAGHISRRWLGAVALVGGLLATISMRINTYQWDRLTAFVNPQSAAAFHVRRSLAGIEAGGLLGVGVGASRSKWGYLPNAHTDFIFSVISEEVGLVGAFIVVALFVTFGLLGVRIATQAADSFSSLVAFGITGWIMAQAFANIGAVTGLAPVTGVPLPFVSQGGTAFVSLMVALGLLVDVARRGKSEAKSRSPLRAHSVSNPAR
jgi:cell division protein FtsW